MPKKPKNYVDNRKCCECDSPKTTQGFGSPRWHVHRCDKDMCTGYLCNICYGRSQNRLPDSYSSLIKSMRNFRTGRLDRFGVNGKAIIAQWVAAKTLGLRDLNIDNDNFRQSIDLSEHPIYHNIDVKSGTLISDHCHINIHSKKETFCRVFDTIIVLCMDMLWGSVERVYIIPYEEICHELYVNIYENWSKVLKRNGVGSRFEYIEKFRVDKKFYDDIYKSVDIPTFFSPFDLWSGKYKKIKRCE